jgi:hypothetical protein
MKTSFIVGVVLFCVTTIFSQDIAKRILGNAYSIDKKNMLIYTEKRNHFKGGFSSEYFQNNKVFATKKMVESNIPWQPSFDLDYNEIDYSLKVSSKSNIAYISLKSKGKPVKQSQIKIDSTTVWDSGVHFFILSKWEILTSGAPVTFKLLVPEEADFFSFRLRMLSKKGTFPVRLALEPQSSILRWILDPIIVTYNSNKELVNYEGISDIKDKNFKNFSVRIQYSLY